MMQGDFTDYKPGYYEVEFAQADDFRNKDKTPEDLAKWGTAYAVKFKRDAGTYYWSSRTEPKEDQIVYGHVEPSKSGKSMNFRRDEDPNKGTVAASSNAGGASTANNLDKTKSQAYLKDVTDIPVRFMQSLLGYFDVQTLAKNPTQYTAYIELVKLLTEDALQMIDNIRNGEKPATEPQKASERSLGDEFRNKQSEGEPDLPEGW